MSSNACPEYKRFQDELTDLEFAASQQVRNAKKFAGKKRAERSAAPQGQRIIEHKNRMEQHRLTCLICKR
jgi:hypothetical protein